MGNFKAAWDEFTKDWSKETKFVVYSLLLSFLSLLVIAIVIKLFGGWGIFLIVVFLALAGMFFAIFMSIDEAKNQ